MRGGIYMSDFDVDIDDILNESMGLKNDEEEKDPSSNNETDALPEIDTEETQESVIKDIEEFMEDGDDKSDPKEIPAEDQKSELESLRNRLKLWTESCSHKLIDLRAIDFMASSDDLSVTYQEKSIYPRPLHFKSDPDNPTNPKILHAMNQFSKMIGIPPKFFLENRPRLKMDIVKNFQAGLEAVEDKAQCLVHYRETQDYTTIRAFTPLGHSTIANHELVDTIIRGSEMPLGLLFAHGDEKDDLILHARILFKDGVKEALGRKFCLGFSLIASELGASPLIIDSCVHDIESNTSYMASYGKGPYFKSKYEVLQPKQIKEIFAKLVERILEEREEMIDRIAQRVEQNPQIVPAEEIVSINRMKGITSKVSKSIYQQMAACEDDITSPLDFARHVSLVAKDFDSIKRLEIERAAGTYLNLIFSKA